VVFDSWLEVIDFKSAAVTRNGGPPICGIGALKGDGCASDRIAICIGDCTADPSRRRARRRRLLGALLRAWFDAGRTLSASGLIVVSINKEGMRRNRLRFGHIREALKRDYSWRAPLTLCAQARNWKEQDTAREKPERYKAKKKCIHSQLTWKASF
jgi:hypothetical protein